MALDHQSDRRFSATHWSVILQARGEDEAGRQALAQLCEKYWYPIYAFLRRRPNTSPHDAEDLTQGFFEHMLAGDRLCLATPESGQKFRTFLLACLENFVKNEHRNATAHKRVPQGGPPISFDAEEAEDRFRLEPAGGPDPSRLYEIKWAEALIENSLRRLREECAAEGKAQLFDVLRPHLIGEAGRGEGMNTAQNLGMNSGALRTAASRMRARFREHFRAEIAATVGSPHEVDQEIRYLLTLWNR